MTDTKHTLGALEYCYRQNGSENDGSIYWMKRPNHACCVARAPRYASKEQWEADAARIVHTCNCHDDLVRALQSIKTQIQEIEDGDRPFTGFDTELLDAVIAKAKGEVK